MNATFNSGGRRARTSNPCRSSVLRRVPAGWLALVALLLPACGSSSASSTPPPPTQADLPSSSAAAAERLAAFVLASGAASNSEGQIELADCPLMGGSARLAVSLLGESAASDGTLEPRVKVVSHASDGVVGIECRVGSAGLVLAVFSGLGVRDLWDHIAKDDSQAVADGTLATACWAQPNPECTEVWASADLDLLIGIENDGNQLVAGPWVAAHLDDVRTSLIELTPAGS